jgi:hypothetical protein
MSQVFSADAVNNTATTTVTLNAETPAVTGNFLSPPFQNAKAFIEAALSMTVGTGAAGCTVRIRRNPNAENVVVAQSGVITTVPGNVVVLSFQAADSIPGPGPVQYQFTIQYGGATGNGSITFASICVTLISG